MKIVTFACDLYADIAPAYHHMLQKAWPDCPYDLVYVTNSKPLNIDATVVYLPGQDIEYGRRLRKFVSLHCQDDELVLLMMIDYLPKGVNPGLIKKAEELCSRHDVAHVRLRPMPHPQLPLPALLAKSYSPDDFGLIDKRERYSLSLQPGIWEPQSIAQCLRDKWNPWWCETRGSTRTKRIQKHFISTQRPAITHHNYYIKRKPCGVRWVMDRVPEDCWPDAAKRKATGQPVDERSIPKERGSK